MNRCEDISSHYWWVYTAAKNTTKMQRILHNSLVHQNWQQVT